MLLTNFTDVGNLLGRGVTIVDYNPTTKKLATFATLPHDLTHAPAASTCRRR